jgi:hypothetical protein
MTSVVVNDATQTVVVIEGDGIAVVTAPSPAAVVQIDGLGPQGPGGVLGLYGSFIDTTDQPLVSTAAAQSITINTTLENRGVTIASNSRITFALAGTYKILASIQITNSGNAIAEVNFFFKKNGAIVSDSNTRIDLQQRKSVSVPYHGCFTIEYQLTVADNDYVELWWASDHINVTLDTIASEGIHPQAPSVILNVAQVMYAQTDAFRSITIAGPQPGDNFTLFRTTRQITITGVVGIVSGGSVTYALRYAADRTTAGTLATVSDTVTNTTTGDAATVQNQPIPSGRYVWVEITATTAPVNEFNLSVAF